MELAKKLCSPHFLRLAVNSLLKAQVISVPIPIVSIMLAQAEGSLGLKENWESGLRLEWFSWPPGLSIRLYFSLFYQSSTISDLNIMYFCVEEIISYWPVLTIDYWVSVGLAIEREYFPSMNCCIVDFDKCMNCSMFLTDTRSAEILFQMHLLAKQSKVDSDQLRVELCQSPLRWVLRAIHVNPSCVRYWNVLQSLWNEG